MLNGVRLAIHSIKISLSNTGTITQNAVIKILAGSYLHTRSSNPPQSPVPNRDNPRQTLPSDVSAGPFTLTPGGNYEYTVLVHGGPEATQFYIHDNNTGHIFGNTSLPANNPLIAPVNCLSLETSFTFAIIVSESNGSLVGSVSTTVHRIEGSVDFPLSSSGTYWIAGGNHF